MASSTSMALIPTTLGRLVQQPTAAALVPPAGVEPAACPLGRGRSIRLSYGGVGDGVYPHVAEPSTPSAALATTSPSPSARGRD